MSLSNSVEFSSETRDPAHSARPPRIPTNPVSFFSPQASQGPPKASKSPHLTPPKASPNSGLIFHRFLMPFGCQNELKMAPKSMQNPPRIEENWMLIPVSYFSTFVSLFFIKFKHPEPEKTLIFIINSSKSAF